MLRMCMCVPVTERRPLPDTATRLDLHKVMSVYECVGYIKEAFVSHGNIAKSAQGYLCVCVCRTH